LNLEVWWPSSELRVLVVSRRLRGTNEVNPTAYQVSVH